MIPSLILQKNTGAKFFHATLKYLKKMLLSERLKLLFLI